MAIFGTPTTNAKLIKLSEQRTEDGKTLCKFKFEKFNITATYNEPAIRDFNEGLNELAHDWVERQYAKEQEERASA